MSTKIFWQGHEVGPVIALQIPEESVAITAISDPIQNSKISLFSNLPAAQNSKAREDFGRQIIESLGEAHSSYTFRVIGSPSLVKSTMELLSTYGFKLGKEVNFHHQARTIHFLPAEGRLRIPVGSNEKIKVLVVDDSETIQKILKIIIDGDSDLQCVGTIGHPHQAEEAIKRLKPDVITMDIHMPDLSGVQLVKQLLPKYPIPIVMISSISIQESNEVLDALDSGAVDYIQKPSMKEIPIVTPQIREKIKTAASAKVTVKKQSTLVASPLKFSKEILDLEYLIAIGSSTGGTEALREILTSLPEQIPPIVIVQHIPAVFSKAFADRMNTLCPFTIKEAEQGDVVSPSFVYIAPGGRQMKLKNKNGRIEIQIEDSMPVNRHKPSVDVLFDSLADLSLPKVTAAILTGMGADGAKGLLRLRQAGAHTIGQDEATSVVYGMPKEAFKLGAVETVSPLGDVARHLVSFCALKQKHKIAL